VSNHIICNMLTSLCVLQCASQANSLLAMCLATRNVIQCESLQRVLDE
jgi:hypothetical protein